MKYSDRNFIKINVVFHQQRMTEQSVMWIRFETERNKKKNRSFVKRSAPDCTYHSQHSFCDVNIAKKIRCQPIKTS